MGSVFVLAFDVYVVSISAYTVMASGYYSKVPFCSNQIAVI